MAFGKKKKKEDNLAEELETAATELEETIEEDGKGKKKKKKKEKEDKPKVEISEDIQRLIYVFAGLALVLIGYFLVFRKISDENTLLQNQISQLSSEVAMLQDMDAKKEDNLKEIDRMKKESQAIIDQYPADVKEEDIMYFVDALERIQSFEGFSEGFMEKTLVVSAGESQDQSALNTAAQSANDTSAVDSTEAEINGTTATTAPAATDANGQPATQGGYALYATGSTLDYRAGYADLKNAINQILNASGKKSIESIDMVFDQDTALINGSITMNDYSMEGTGKEYVPSPIEAVKQGKDNPFGTNN